MTGKKWFITFLILSLLTVLLIGGTVFVVDPFFHYRGPNRQLFYLLGDQRSQNDGITKHFDYDSIITGTSMAENFRASQMDFLFGVNTVKVCYSGATNKELNDNLKVAYDSGHNVKYVLRTIDYTMLVTDKDEMRTDMGEFPVWLTNDNPIDDVKYLLNRDVIINYTFPCLWRFVTGTDGGYTSFDDYSFTGNDNTFGVLEALGGRSSFDEPGEIIPATDEELEKLEGNVSQNIVELAKEHPETTFLYFYPPYSLAYWGGINENGEISKYMTIIRKTTEMMLECDNIHVYGFDLETDITGNLNNYRDAGHYSPDINTWILDTIAYEEKGDFGHRLTKDNYLQYLADFEDILESYDYPALLSDK